MPVSKRFCYSHLPASRVTRPIFKGAASTWVRSIRHVTLPRQIAMRAAGERIESFRHLEKDWMDYWSCGDEEVLQRS